MEDNFKKHIEQNKEQVEDFYDTDFTSIWGNVNAGLDKERRRSKAFSWKVAAILLAFIMSGYLAFKVGQRSQQTPTELAEAEIHYIPMISKKMSLIKAHHDQVDQIIWDDMQQIDQACKELKDDLRDQVDNEEVISAIIQNYRIKLEILDQLLKEIENKKNENSKKPTIGI